MVQHVYHARKEGLGINWASHAHRTSSPAGWKPIGAGRPELSFLNGLAVGLGVAVVDQTYETLREWVVVDLGFAV